MTRIFNDKLDENKPKINLKLVKNFFDDRAKKADNLGYKSAVIYQDKNLQLAEDRDTHEKQVLLPKLLLKKEDRCLDIGCGTGRWADAVVSQVEYYHGIDFSSELLRIARERFLDVHNVKFTCLKCEDLKFDRLNDEKRFNKILCFGVLIYLNDEDISEVMRGIVDCASEDCLLLLREPIGVDQRLTIVEHYSEDMEQHYNAVYRTKEELLTLCNDVLGRHKFKLVESGDVFLDASLNNRKETKQCWFLFKKQR